MGVDSDTSPTAQKEFGDNEDNSGDGEDGVGDRHTLIFGAVDLRYYWVNPLTVAGGFEGIVGPAWLSEWISDAAVQRCAIRYRNQTPGGIIATMAFARITVDSEHMGGVPCIRGLRFPVATVIAMLGDGMTSEEILDEHPALEAADIVEALKYAALAVQERELPLRLPA